MICAYGNLSDRPAYSEKIWLKRYVPYTSTINLEMIAEWRRNRTWRRTRRRRRKREAHKNDEIIPSIHPNRQNGIDRSIRQWTAKMSTLRTRLRKVGGGGVTYYNNGAGRKNKTWDSFMFYSVYICHKYLCLIDYCLRFRLNNVFTLVTIKRLFRFFWRGLNSLTMSFMVFPQYRFMMRWVPIKLV